MKRTFFLLCAVLLVAGSLLPLAGYRLATAALGRAAPEAAESAPEPAASDPAALPEASVPPSDQDSESFLIRDLRDGAVAAVPRREYLIGAVAAEMPITWPDEALKAQAIAAHSYALYCRDHAADPAAGWLTADPARRQGYLTDTVLRSYWGTAYEENHARLAALVDAVETQVLYYVTTPPPGPATLPSPTGRRKPAKTSGAAPSPTSSPWTAAPTGRPIILLTRSSFPPRRPKSC